MTDVRSAPPPADDGGLAAFRRWWGDHAIAQAIALAFAVALVAWLAANVIGSMHRLGMAPSLDYLSQPANFDISESLLVYHAGDPYARAILVGVLNTLKLAVAGCALATAIGVALGVAARRRQSAVVGSDRRLCRDRAQHAADAAIVLLDRDDPRAAAGAPGAAAVPPRLSLGARRLPAVARGRQRRDLADPRAARRAGRRRPLRPQAAGAAVARGANGCSSPLWRSSLPRCGSSSTASASRSTCRRSKASTSSAASA